MLAPAHQSSRLRKPRGLGTTASALLPHHPKAAVAWTTLALGSAAALALASALCSNFTHFRACRVIRPRSMATISLPAHTRSPAGGHERHRSAAAAPMSALDLLASARPPSIPPSLSFGGAWSSLRWRAHKDASTYCTFSRDHTSARAGRAGHFQSPASVCWWKRGRSDCSAARS